MDKDQKSRRDSRIVKRYPSANAPGSNRLSGPGQEASGSPVILSVNGDHGESAYGCVGPTPKVQYFLNGSDTGGRARYRDVVEDGGAFSLKEEAATYSLDLGPEMVALSAKKRLFRWKLKHIHSVVSVRPPKYQVDDNLPEGSRLLGYEDYTVQDLLIQPHNTRYRLARYQTPDGKALIGVLPEALQGSHFGITLKSHILYPEFDSF